MDKVRLGEKIRTLRKESGIARQDDLASKAGVSVRVIKEIEGGKGNQTLDNLVSVFEVLNVGFGNFLAELASAPTTKKPPEIVKNLDVSHIQPDPNLILSKLTEIEQGAERQQRLLINLAKDLEDAAKWRATEAHYEQLKKLEACLNKVGADVIPALMKSYSDHEIALRRALDLPRKEDTTAPDKSVLSVNSSLPDKPSNRK